MGLTNRNENRKTYLNIVGGKIARRVKEGDEGAVKRYSEKKQEDLYERYYDELSGIIRRLEIEESDYGKNLKVTISDIGEDYVLNIPVESKFFDSFCAKIKSANLNASLTLIPYSFTDKEGKKLSGMNIYQDGEKLPYFYSKEDPKGKPMPEGELDDDEWKIFKIKERKFYTAMIASLNMNILNAPQNTLQKADDTITEPEKENGDLPF